MFPQTDEVKKRAVKMFQRMWKTFVYLQENNIKALETS